MNGLLAEAAHAVTGVLAAEWHGNTWKVEFQPLADPALGDVGTDALLQIARDLRENPEALAQRILARLDGSPLGQFSFIEGFLNLHFADAKLCERWDDAAKPPPECRTILVVPRRSGTDSLGYARVVSSASMQWFLSSPGTIISSLAGQLTRPCAWPEFRQWFEQSVCAGDGVDVIDSALQKLITNLKDGMPISLWVYSNFLERRKFRALLEAIEKRSGSACAVMSLDRDAMTRLGAAIDKSALAALSAEELAAMIIYLSRGVSGVDVDLLAVKHEERSNLRWSLGALMQSMRRWAHLQEKSGAAVELNPAERLIVICCNAIAAFRRMAAEQGKISEYLAQIEAMIEQTGRYLNNPMMRIRLEKGENTPAFFEIIAGVRRASSDIINSCLLFQSLAPAQQPNR